MTIRTPLVIWSVLTATIAALSLGPSFAHVLESLPRLTQWSPELWREATVFNAQFWLFAAVGAPLDLSALAFPAILAFMLRRNRPAFYFAIAAALLYAASLAAWFLLVAPANSVLATWSPGPIPENFDAIRLRWETGHMAVAAIKLVGFVMIALTLVSIRRSD
ncbi:DUF1772 domain-containing protein [Mesorhizobium sp. WSM2239]|uniref:DUF1772 domain-containing protein n=2 Tax=unclassified Mesorhizobium TaxID=325217 RepID=A0AAU8DEQ6_9HYPH